MVEQRDNAVMEVLRDGHMVVEVAERSGVSRPAVHRWLGRYQQGGLDAWPTAPIGLAAVHTSSLRSLRPACASCAGPSRLGATAAGP